MEKSPQINVKRFPSEADWTLSEFFIGIGFDRTIMPVVRSGVGVEDEYRDKKVFGETRIPNGIYEMDLVDSPRFSKSFYMDENGYLNKIKNERFNIPHLLIHVKDVPGFSNILWHWGNTDVDTHGCYIVGSDFDTFDKRKGVSASKVKYIEIYPVIYQLIRANKKAGVKTLVQYSDAEALS